MYTHRHLNPFFSSSNDFFSITFPSCLVAATKTRPSKVITELCTANECYLSRTPHLALTHVSRLCCPVLVWLTVCPSPSRPLYIAAGAVSPDRHCHQKFCSQEIMEAVFKEGWTRWVRWGMGNTSPLPC